MSSHTATAFVSISLFFSFSRSFYLCLFTDDDDDDRHHEQRPESVTKEVRDAFIETVENASASAASAVSAAIAAERDHGDGDGENKSSALRIRRECGGVFTAEDEIEEVDYSQEDYDDDEEDVKQRFVFEIVTKVDRSQGEQPPPSLIRELPKLPHRHHHRPRGNRRRRGGGSTGDEGESARGAVREKGGSDGVCADVESSVNGGAALIAGGASGGDAAASSDGAGGGGGGGDDGKGGGKGAGGTGVALAVMEHGISYHVELGKVMGLRHSLFVVALIMVCLFARERLSPHICSSHDTFLLTVTCLTTAPNYFIFFSLF